LQSDFNFQKIKSSFKDDLLAAFSVSLVALPLALGVALASGVPPMAGIWSAIAGGLITTFFRGGHISINGPAAGLIVVILGGLESLKDSDELISGFPYVLAATVIAGAIQVILGWLRLGKLADMVPASVINGMLAAIGVIIASKQIHYALGVKAESSTTLGAILEIPQSLISQNPFISIIALLSLVILLLHPRIKSKLVHAIPAPIWVLLFSIPFVFIFNLFEVTQWEFFGTTYSLGPKYLVDVPSNALDSILFPNFSKIGYPSFWLFVMTLTIIASIQTLVVAKAVDKLDKEGRQTNLNQDLIGVGLGNILSGAIGGLPLIAVIVRSSVNITNGAKTRWSNFYHGLILLVFVILLPSFIQMIPLAALAALLVFTGYKLASPKMFRDSAYKGWEQITILIITLLATLWEGLLVGIGIGMFSTFLIHYWRSGLEFRIFLQHILKPNLSIRKGATKGGIYVQAKGILNFLNILKLKQTLKALPKSSHLILDVSRSNVVDYTVLEYLHDQAANYDLKTADFDIIGLDVHRTSSRHPNALHILKAQRPIRLTRRQKELAQIAEEYQAAFYPARNWEVNKFKIFQFFKSRPLEYRINVSKGEYAESKVNWEFCDLIFDEGALIATEEYHSSILCLKIPFALADFILERETVLDRIGVRLHLQKDLNFKAFRGFSERFLLRGEDEKAIRQIFQAPLIHYLEEHEIYHIEVVGDQLLIFKYMRFSSPKEVREMHQFAVDFLEILIEINNTLERKA
jgi:MFS superfamily sulfate permease-like transporter